MGLFDFYLLEHTHLDRLSCHDHWRYLRNLNRHGARLPGKAGGEDS